MNADNRQLTLTRKELRTLVQIAAMGEWLACSGKKIDKRFSKAVDDLAQRIYDMVMKDGIHDLVYFDEDRRRFSSEPVIAVSDSPVAKAIRALEKEVYEDEFSRQLSTNAAIREVGEEVWKKMDFESKFQLVMYHEERISNALERHGLNAVVVTTGDPAQ